MVLVKRRSNKRDYVNTTKQANSIKTLEPIVNKYDAPENMVMQHSNHWIFIDSRQIMFNKSSQFRFLRNDLHQT
jgi:hypothetical protein